MSDKSLSAIQTHKGAVVQVRATRENGSWTVRVAYRPAPEGANDAVPWVHGAETAPTLSHALDRVEIRGKAAGIPTQLLRPAAARVEKDAESSAHGYWCVDG